MNTNTDGHETWDQQYIQTYQIGDEFKGILVEIASQSNLSSDEIRELEEYAGRLLQIDSSLYKKFSNKDDAFRHFYNPIDNENRLNQALIQTLIKIIEFKFQQ